MIKIHYNTTKNAHKGFTVVKMPLKHKILKKGHKKTIFLKKAKKKPAISGQIWGGLNRLFLAGFFWLAFLGPTLPLIDSYYHETDSNSLYVFLPKGMFSHFQFLMDLISYF